MANRKQCANCKFYLETADFCTKLLDSPVYEGTECKIESGKEIANSKPAASSAISQPIKKQQTQQPSHNKDDDNPSGKSRLWLFILLTALTSLFLMYIGARGLGAFVLFFAIGLLLLLLFKPHKKGKGLKVTYMVILIVVASVSYIFALIRFADSDNFDYNRAISYDSLNAYKSYESHHIHGEHLSVCKDSIAAKEFELIKRNYNIYDHQDFIVNCKQPKIKARALAYLDDKYEYATSKLTEKAQQNYKQFYLDEFPDGKHYDEIKKELYEELEQKAYDFAIEAETLGAYENFLKEYPDGPHSEKVKELISDYKLAHKYDGNYLSTGSQPYANVYGRNQGGNGCSIKVKASSNSDVVVIVKRNNSNGRVAGHAYIRQGGSYTINLNPGVYQVFFYYGRDWNPTKKLSNGLTGGFMHGEQYGKDDPLTLSVHYYSDYISYDQMEYSLQSVVGGNFSMEHSNAKDVF